MTKNIKTIQHVLRTLVDTTSIIFLTLASLNVFSVTPRAIVFTDFWRRLTVYSLWFMAFGVYRNCIGDKTNETITI